MNYEIVHPDDDYKTFWDKEYKVLNPLKSWLESQGYYCELKPPQTCLRIYTKVLGFLPRKLIIRVCLKGRIEVGDKEHQFLAEQINEKIRELGDKEDK